MTTRAETIDLLAKDYEKNYFIGGESEMKAYSSSCVFADPFVSFTGLDRFKQNVGNLGTSLRDVECKVLKTVDNGVGGVIFYWKFSAVVDALPWRPKLAASGNTTHVLDDANKVVKHIEAWDVDPWVVLKKLLVPKRRSPQSRERKGNGAKRKRMLPSPQTASAATPPLPPLHTKKRPPRKTMPRPRSIFTATSSAPSIPTTPLKPT